MTKKHEDGFRLNRRQLLKGAASVSLASALSPLTEIRATSTKVDHDLIRAENEKLGTTDWLLQNTRVDPKTRYRCPWIEGYCSHTSIGEGDQLRIMVSTDPPSPFVIDLYRLGYYGGDGARKIADVPVSAVLPQTQPACLSVAATGLVDCGNWAESASWTVPSTAVSGIYFAKLVREAGGAGSSHVAFVVRGPHTQVVRIELGRGGQLEPRA